MSMVKIARWNNFQGVFFYYASVDEKLSRFVEVDTSFNIDLIQYGLFFVSLVESGPSSERLQNSVINMLLELPRLSKLKCFVSMASRVFNLPYFSDNNYGPSSLTCLFLLYFYL